LWCHSRCDVGVVYRPP